MKKTLSLFLALVLALFCAAALADGTWICETCGRENDSNFCPKCGRQREFVSTWYCSKCGAPSSLNFCGNCGNPKPVYSTPGQSGNV